MFRLHSILTLFNLSCFLSITFLTGTSLTYLTPFITLINFYLSLIIDVIDIFIYSISHSLPSPPGR